MVREYDHHPPASSGYFEWADANYAVKAGTMRGFDFHKYQNFTVLDGSGNSSNGFDDEQLAIDQTTGSGPLYDTWLIYQNPPSGDNRASGINLIQIGDFLAIADLDYLSGPLLDPNPVCFHKYVIRDILARPSEVSGEFRVEWLDLHCDNLTSDQSPASGCASSQNANYYGSSCTDTRTIIFREVNMPFLLSD